MSAPEDRPCWACAGEGVVECSTCGGGSVGLDPALTCTSCRGRSDRLPCPACSGRSTDPPERTTEERVALSLHLHGLVDEAFRQTPDGRSVHARLATLLVEDLDPD